MRYPVLARRLLLAASLAALWGPPARGQDLRAQARGRTLAGVVTDTARHPIPSVEVGLLWGREIVRTTRTDSAGRFQLADLPRGKISIVARRLGFQPRVYTVQIREGATRAFLPVVLDPMPAELDKVIVLARVAASGGRLKEFYERKSRHGWGRFIEREEIERRHPMRMSDMLRTIPGVRVLPGRGFANVVRMRGGCAPTVWLDGLPLRGTEIDEVVFPSEVAGVEVYHSVGMPIQFMSHGGCGAIVVWTRID
jgi:hypothetical protein